MFEPELYHRVHKTLKSVAGQIIREYFNKVQWHDDGSDILMDIGSGPGDLLMDYIRPQMPVKFNKIIWSDISADMLDFFHKYYGNPQNIECCVLDITTPMGMPHDLKGTIDHLTSIYCLHMVPDMRMALHNIYNLLRPNGGDCLLVFMSTTTILDSYNYMKNLPKWLDYKQDIEQYIPSIYYTKNPETEIQTQLKNIGFSAVTIEKNYEICCHENLENCKDNIRSICPILKSIPTPALRIEFLDELIANIVRFTSINNNLDDMESEYCVRYDYLVVNARKV